MLAGDMNARVSRCDPWIGPASATCTDSCGSGFLQFLRRHGLCALNTMQRDGVKQDTCFAPLGSSQ
eukprot:14256109-Alexandrium_andersonii.AAC.1